MSNWPGAKRLIEKLVAMPEAFRILGLSHRRDGGLDAAHGRLCLLPDDGPRCTDAFRTWLLGVAQEWADEKGLIVLRQINDARPGNWTKWAVYGSEGRTSCNHDTRLHALLEAMEGWETSHPWPEEDTGDPHRRDADRKTPLERHAEACSTVERLDSLAGQLADLFPGDGKEGGR